MLNDWNVKDSILTFHLLYIEMHLIKTLELKWSLKYKDSPLYLHRNSKDKYILMPQYNPIYFSHSLHSQKIQLTDDFFLDLFYILQICLKLVGLPQCLQWQTDILGTDLYGIFNPNWENKEKAFSYHPHNCPLRGQSECNSYFVCYHFSLTKYTPLIPKFKGRGSIVN